MEFLSQSELDELEMINIEMQMIILRRRIREEEPENSRRRLRFSPLARPVREMDQTEEIRSFDHLGPHVKHRATSSSYDMPSTASMAIDKGPSPSTSPEPSSSSSPEASPEPSSSSSPEASPEPCITLPEAFVRATTSASLLTSFPASFTLSDPPASMMPPSPLSRMPKRKRQRQQDNVVMEFLEQRGTALRQHKEADQFTRFGATLADVMRKMPAERKHEAMCKVYNIAAAFLKE
ncbi:inactive protein tyrosine kinase pTKL [Pleuronectes platessa]|uniref:inactive protein tyrosine kinase pTKL n=1 Tax=Pleuronectes platessa TaxID=8262 RepID=UPI00232A5005|nr:inactive protein tyrosine kinase pTKL [Pleuronectes platessa]